MKNNLVHKRFQYNNEKGGIEVQFNLEYNGNEVIVSTIQINGNYDTNLPSSPELKYHDDKWKFYTEWEEKRGDKYVRMYKYFDDKLSKDLIAMILVIKDEEIPKFIS